MKKFEFIKVFNSPFITPKLKFYFGKIRIGVPYFYPRKWRKFTHKEALNKALTLYEDYKGKRSLLDLYKSSLKYSKAVPKKLGFDVIDLGWKTKWGDYRYEYSPMFSFVFFGFQFAVWLHVDNPDQYWESWLYYNNDTDHNLTKRERIDICRKKAPCTWISYIDDQKITTDYYTKILKSKYL